jgi:sulfofructose kinase
MKILPRDARAIDIVGFGEASIDEVWRLPMGLTLGDKGRALGRDRLGGGQIATALVAAARLGARATYLGPIGDDAIADEIVRGLHEERVAVAEGARRRGETSRTALLLVEADGERTVIESGGASARIDESVLAAIGDARALHLDATRPDAAVILAKHARACGTLVSLDLDFVPADLSLVESADVCVLPRGLAEAMMQTRDALPKLAKRLPEGALVVETQGADGAVFLLDGRLERIAPFRVDVVDTTACGDTFRAALLCGLLDGETIAHAMGFASIAAALKCRSIGRRGCPTRAEVASAMSSKA